ncbi:class I SAM-dependent methyltransferase [Elizabethkingia anophelis]|uniref:class I SAM-dependent methyltransferase n=1 Tax=Elizabethkingia anophelis TaxID=1117645 RepID=UPI000750F919|nr:class I SAM-dependent methyltransferase [Elizabethkingia anophelis]AQW92187.1 methyltransferase [Elizabethkingia anophelis]KUY14672.1 methyltransferase [Elizabethkingia anophelis]
MEFSHILRPEVQQFIKDNSRQDLTKLLLSGSPFSDVNIQEIAQQIKGRQAAEKKFPFLLQDGIVFPPQLNLEQASSEITAAFKASLFSGESLLDLTSGFGIDAYYLSANFNQTTLVEQNENLLDIVTHNWLILNKINTFYLNLNLSEFLEKNDQKFSLIYLDPARRDTHNRKKFLLEDLSPDITEIQNKLFEFTDKVVVKLSPLMDISMLVSQVTGISEIYIIAVKNEVKELLIVIEKDFNQSPTVKIHNLESNEPSLDVTFSTIQQSKPVFGEASEYLYIPNNAVLKSGAFNFISEHYNLEKLHPNTHLYTSPDFIENFPGRVLKVVTVEAKKIEKGERFNIISKNYPLTPDEIKKKYKIKDGGNQYLIFTQSQKGKIILKSI